MKVKMAETTRRPAIVPSMSEKMPPISPEKISRSRPPSRRRAPSSAAKSARIVIPTGLANLVAIRVHFEKTTQFRLLLGLFSVSGNVSMEKYTLITPGDP